MFPSPIIAAIYAVWIIWGASWLIAALWANRTIAKPAASEWRYRIFTFAAWLLLLGYVFRPDGRVPTAGVAAFLWQPLWAFPTPLGWALVAVSIGGCTFAWWARIHLGKLWSASLTRKTGHRVVDSGPYAIVRHPIYTGLLVGAFATAAIRANLAASAGFLLFIVGYWVKALAEEVFLSAELGAANYAAYRARVPMLIPFGPK